MSDRGQLGNFLNEVTNWTWADFCRAEKDPKYTGIQATVFALVRTASEGKLGAIRLSIDRIDGKVETPVKIEYPKIYYLYPHAQSVDGLPEGDPSTELTTPEPTPDPVTEPAAEEEGTLATMTLRETLREMARTDQRVIPLILKKKKEVEEMLRADVEITDKNIPLVKSVIAANLLHLATEKRNFEAITEVFDQIDGKLVETYKVLGEDIFLVQYADVAPAGAVKNKDGIYQLEQGELAELWKRKLSQK